MPLLSADEQARACAIAEALDEEHRAEFLEKLQEAAGRISTSGNQLQQLISGMEQLLTKTERVIGTIERSEREEEEKEVDMQRAEEQLSQP